MKSPGLIPLKASGASATFPRKANLPPSIAEELKIKIIYALFGYFDRTFRVISRCHNVKVATDGWRTEEIRDGTYRAARIKYRGC